MSVKQTDLFPHINHALVAETHPPMYLMHKFWARKPHNVVRQYIEHYSKKGEIVLDPFCGSGVTCVEALRLNRKTIGIDIDPIATFITRLTVLPVNLSEYEAAYATISKNIRDNIEELYETKCPKCKLKARIICTRYSGDTPTKVRNFVCPHCGLKGSKQLSQEDLQKIQEVEDRSITHWYPKDARLYYPDGKPFKKKEQRNYIHELFTKRNLLALSMLFDQILSIQNGPTKDLMLFTFSSTLAQASKMVLWSESSRPSWKVHSYWVPPDNVELNVWDRLENRYQAILRGKRAAEEVSNKCHEGTFAEIMKDKTFLVSTQSAVDLKAKPAQIEDESVDYVFTDPPYGGSVQYMELSTIWSAWLARSDHRFEMNYDDEITINDSQGKHFDFYHKMLRAAFAEVYRVLKKGRWLTVTFHNTDIKIYNSIIKAVVLAGFELEKIIYQPPAKRGAKQQLQPYGSAVGDYYIRFRKPMSPYSLASEVEIDKERYERIVVDAVRKIIALRGEPSPYSVIINSYSNIYDELKANGYLFSAPEGIEAVLKQNIGKEFTLESGKWWLKEPSSVPFLESVPLNERVERAVVNRLNRELKVSFDEILQEVFLSFPNALTPETRTVQEVLKEYAKKTPDKKWMLKPSVKKREDEHNTMVELLASIGKRLGFQVIADLPGRRVTGLPFECKSPDRVMKIDAIWLDKTKPRYEFEVENTTSITEAIVRGANLPNGDVKRVIVIPEERKSLLKRKIREPVLREKIEQYGWRFTYYANVQSFYESLSKSRKPVSANAFEKSFSLPDEIRTETQAKLETF